MVLIKLFLISGLSDFEISFGAAYKQITKSIHPFLISVFGDFEISFSITS